MADTMGCNTARWNQLGYTQLSPQPQLHTQHDLSTQTAAPPPFKPMFKTTPLLTIPLPLTAHLEDAVTQWLREAKAGLADVALHELNHRAREGQLSRLLNNAVFVKVVLHHELRQVTNNLAAGCHLHNVTQSPAGMKGYVGLGYIQG